MNVLQGRGEKVAGSQIASETRLQCVGCTTWNEISWEWKGKRSLQNAKGQMLGKQRGEEAQSISLYVKILSSIKGTGVQRE